MKYILISTVLILSFFNTKSQGITRISSNDNISYPLKNYDNGVSFTYFNNNYGKIGAYFKFNNHTYELFSNKEVIYGEGKFKISARELQDIFLLKDSYIKVSLILSHNSVLRNIYSDNEIDFFVKINAPYGSTFYDYPPRPNQSYYPKKPTLYNYQERPNLYSTNNIKKKTRGSSVLGITLGVGIMVGGIKLAIDNSSQEETSEENNNESIWIIIGGIALTSYSYSKLHYNVDDYKLNNYYENLNENLLTEWHNGNSNIENLNENILEQWNRRKNEIYIQNVRSLEQWQIKKNEIDQLNTLIKNSVTIKIML